MLKGTIEGDADAEIDGFARIESGKPGKICFYANPKYEQYVYGCKASALIVKKDFKPEKPLEITLIRVDDPYSSIAFLLKYVSEQKRRNKRHRGWLSKIARSSKIGSNVYVGDFAYIGRDAEIGDDTVIYENVYVGAGTKVGKNCIFYPGVRIYPGMIIGNNVIIHSNAVIGSDGFGNAPRPDGSWEKIEHIGNVIIGNDVEIGANTTIDRSEFDSTVIGNGVKIDNLCQIAHNVVIGDNTVMAAQVGIAGSAKIGKNCIIAGQVGIAGHLTVADNTTLGAQSGVLGNIRKEGTVLLGSPAIDAKKYLRSYAVFKTLSD